MDILSEKSFSCMNHFQGGLDCPGFLSQHAREKGWHDIGAVHSIHQIPLSRDIDPHPGNADCHSGVYYIRGVFVVPPGDGKSTGERRSRVFDYSIPAAGELLAGYGSNKE